MSGIREGLLDIVRAGSVQVIQERQQHIVVESFTIEAGGILIIRAGGRLVVMS